ncbi:MAG: hypothetical protein PUJ42_10865, partial [Bacteroidales bacterium]|nr:hypothetical protein [Bacteroidales bacterium]
VLLTEVKERKQKITTKPISSLNLPTTGQERTKNLKFRALTTLPMITNWLKIWRVRENYVIIF